MPAPTEVGQGFRPKLLHEPENGEGTRPDLAPQRDRRCTQHVADALNEATNLHLVTPPPHHLTLPRTKSPPSATDPRTTDTPPARTSDIGPGAAAPASSTFLEQIWSMATRGVGTDERRSHAAITLDLTTQLSNLAPVSAAPAYSTRPDRRHQQAPLRHLATTPQAASQLRMQHLRASAPKKPHLRTSPPKKPHLITTARPPRGQADPSPSEAPSRSGAPRARNWTAPTTPSGGGEGRGRGGGGSWRTDLGAPVRPV